MKFFKKLAIVFFDIIDLYYHQRKILKFLEKNNVNLKIFFDVGSHMGTYTDLVIRKFKKCKILMFEPQLDIFKKIKIKYRYKTNIKTFNYAISNKSIQKKMYINQHNLTSSLCPLDVKNNRYLQLKAKLFGTTASGMILKKINVKTRKLASIIKFKKIKKIDLMKIDTEGHELEVLKGIQKAIKNIRYILIEFHNDKIYLSYNPKKVHNYLIKNNFVLKKVCKFPFTTWEDRFYFNTKFK